MNLLLHLGTHTKNNKQSKIMKMKGFNMIVVAVSLSLVAFFNLPVAIGAPYMLSDDRVRSLEITPVLGRGYSVMTNNFLSTCLEGAETTVPSYNYDCK